jgi:hypothetical protein
MTPATSKQKLALMRTLGFDLPGDLTYAAITCNQASELLDGVPFIPPSDKQLLLAAEYGVTVTDGMSSADLSEQLDERAQLQPTTGSATYKRKLALIRAIGVDWPEGVDITNVTQAQANAMLDECVLVPPSDPQLVFAAELGIDVPLGISYRSLSDILDVARELSDKDSDAAKAELLAKNPSIQAGNMVVVDDLPYRIERIYKRRGMWVAHVITIQAIRDRITDRIYQCCKALPLINLAHATKTDLMTYTREHTGILH